MENLIWALIPITAIVCTIGIPIWTHHKRAMLQLRLKMGQDADSSVLAEMQALKQQMAEMRDTTTRYDMSFDAALQRIESRVGHVEGRVNSIEASETRQITQDVR